MPNCAGCNKPDAKMQCPKCAELALPPTFFCEQSCFKTSWKTHKEEHSKPAPCYLDSMAPEASAMFKFCGKLRPGKLSAKRTVPKSIKRPDYADHPQGFSASEEKDARSGRGVIPVADATDIAGMRATCKFAREVIDTVARAVRPGVTTDELDRITHEACIERSCYPSPLNYMGFRKSVCTSVNEIICHGIPDSRELEEGDIVNLDVTTFFNNYHGDVNETVFVGRPSEESINLVKTAYECLHLGIGECKPGTFYRNVGSVIEPHARSAGLSVVRNYVGHGIGRLFHTVPNVPHYAKSKAVGVMKPGHIFSLEPMINQGVWQDVTWPDGWTSSTADGKWSAQFEETLLVTDKGVDILTGRAPDQWPTWVKQLEALGLDIKPIAGGPKPILEGEPKE